MSRDVGWSERVVGEEERGKDGSEWAWLAGCSVQRASRMRSGHVRTGAGCSQPRARNAPGWTVRGRGQKETLSQRRPEFLGKTRDQGVCGPRVQGTDHGPQCSSCAISSRLAYSLSLHRPPSYFESCLAYSLFGGPCHGPSTENKHTQDSGFAELQTLFSVSRRVRDHEEGDKDGSATNNFNLARWRIARDKSRAISIEPGL